MLKRLMMLGVVCLVLIGMCEAFLPLVISEGIAKAIKVYGDAQSVDVQVKKTPALAMLGGKFDVISVTAKQVQTDKIIFDELQIQLEDANINTINLLKNKEFLLNDVKNATVSAVVLEHDLATLVNKRVKGAKDTVVTITPQKVMVNGMISIGNVINTAAALEGRIIASDNRIIFLTEHFKIDNPLLGNFSGAVFTDLVLVDFKDMPFDVKVKQVVLEDGKVLIKADNRE